MRLYELIVHSTDHISDRVINTLSLMKAVKVDTEDKISIKAYFLDTENLVELTNNIRCVFGNIDILVNILHENNWTQFIRENYNPIDISPNVIIKPSWAKITTDKIIILLDRGNSFGYDHDTTKMCALALDKYIQKDDYILDVGSGSGILSLIASKLGAYSVTALDISPIAIKETKNNIIKNSIHNINTIMGTIDSYQGHKFNIIVANLITDTLLSIANPIKNNLIDFGICILSAIDILRCTEVLKLYESLGFKLIDSIEANNWCTLVLRLK